jgi:hypothetical protein
MAVSLGKPKRIKRWKKATFAVFQTAKVASSGALKKVW